MNKQTDAIEATVHIKTYEIYTKDGYLLNVLSTTDKIKEYPLFKEIISINDVNGEIIWLSAQDEELWQRAFEQWHTIAI